MKRIVFGITSLEIGGAERVLVDLVNKIKDEYEITIFTIYGNGSLEKSLPKNIRIQSLYSTPYETMSNFQKKWIPLYVLTCGNSIYNKYIKGKFDVEVAFLEGAITRIFSNKAKNNTKKIVWVHNDISQVFGIGLKNAIKNFIDKFYYNRYDKIIFVSKDNKRAFNDLYDGAIGIEKQEVIYNYIDSDIILKKAEAEEINLKGTNTIVTVARLTEQKAIDRFAKVHKKLLEQGIISNVYIIGDGPERENLQKLIKELNIEGTFNLLGKKGNPYPYIKSADYFALLSNYEGYGMVIEEAKILHKPIIITNTAAREALTDYSSKIILENSENGIYEGLKKVLTNNANKRAIDNYKYNGEKILGQIKKIF